ncbi:MAG: hypothetical protein FD180_985 [Planctomycetota bacterium]|nr:MAG: hypothetical protein FD180_985 [Planctomycetota bacterium]
MKNLIVLSLVAATVSMAGCRYTTATGTGDRSISIVRPLDQTLRRGEINRVAVTVLRRGFRSDILIEFDGLPSGVKVIETARRYAESDIFVSYTLYAANDAPAVHEALVTVTAKGPGGLSASEIFQVTVKAEETGMK